MTHRQLLNTIAARLAGGEITNSCQEARWLIASELPTIARLVHTAPFATVAPETVAACFAKLDRRLAGMPLQYVLGTTEFYGLSLEVTPDVLIPRPETEILVDQALRTTPTLPPGACLDLCCGSGAIACALAAHLYPDRTVWATDLSEAALSVTRANATRLGLSLQLRAGDLFTALLGHRFAVIVSNPPYVSEGEYAELSPEVRAHEPRLALEAGSDGLDVIRRLAAAAPEYLLPDGAIFCEVGATQARKVEALFRGAGLADTRVHRDLAGRDRIIEGHMPEES